MSTFRDFLKQLVNTQVVIDNVEYPNTYADDLSIDRTNLEEEFVTHSERYAYYATLAEMADDRADRMKEDLEHLAAKLDMSVRDKAKALQMNDPKFRMTETMVENEVKNSAEYQRSQKEYQEARTLSKLLKNAPHAFAHRRDMLIELGKTSMSSMSDPRVQTGRQQLVKNIIGAQRQLNSKQAPQLPIPGNEPRSDVEDSGPYTGTHCVVCHQPQFSTPGGNTCSNGHGGAFAMEESGPEILEQYPVDDNGQRPGQSTQTPTPPPRRRPARQA